MEFNSGKFKTFQVNLCISENILVMNVTKTYCNIILIYFSRNKLMCVNEKYLLMRNETY